MSTNPLARRSASRRARGTQDSTIIPPMSDIRSAALHALGTAEPKTPAGAVALFKSIVIQDAALSQQYLRWLDSEIGADEGMLAFLRSIVAEQSDTSGRTSRSARAEAERRNATKSSNVMDPLKLGPTAAEIEAARKSRKRAIAVIYRTTSIDGQPLHTYTPGQLKSLDRVKEKLMRHHGNEYVRHAKDRALIRHLLGYANVVDDTVSIMDVVPPREVENFVRMVNEEFSREMTHA